MEVWSKEINHPYLKVQAEDVVSPGYGATRADDSLYVENRRFSTTLYFILAGVFLLVACIFLTLEEHAILVFSVASIPAVFCLLYGIYGPAKQLTYDRLNDTITLSRPLFLKHKVLKFSTGYAVKAYYSATEGIIDSSLLFVPDKRKLSFGGKITDTDQKEYWHFTVWYMDKNRPLPPGTAFDQHRQKDYERRKAEGFPKPLYPSAIPTPEATRAQQRERERIGGW